MTEGEPSPEGFSASTQRTLLVTTLVLFGGLTLVAVIRDGLPGTLAAITFNWASLQIYVDLVLAVAVISVWIHRDARSRGENPWPWIIAAFIVGMFSPLIYLLKTNGRR